MKKISVIVPVYNCEKYLTDCFESIKKQGLIVKILKLLLLMMEAVITV